MSVKQKVQGITQFVANAAFLVAVVILLFKAAVAIVSAAPVPLGIAFVAGFLSWLLS